MDAFDEPAAQPVEDALLSYVRELASGPAAERPPISIVESTLPVITQFFEAPPPPEAPGNITNVSSSGGSFTPPVVDGFYGLDVTSGVASWVKQIAPVTPAGNGFYGLNVTSTVASWETAVPAPPVGDGFYGLKIASSVITWEKELAPVIPTVDGTYVMVISTLVGTWTLKKLPPDIPDGIPGVDAFYVLRRNSMAEPEWVALETASIPDCSGGEAVYLEVFKKPAP